MTSNIPTDALFKELDEQVINIPVSDEDAAVPTIECASDDHNGEPIREGERAIALLVRTDDGEWTVEDTFCKHCSVLDEFTAVDDDKPTAIIGGSVIPENENGTSETVYLLDAYLWELYEGDPV